VAIGTITGTNLVEGLSLLPKTGLQG